MKLLIGSLVRVHKNCTKRIDRRLSLLKGTKLLQSAEKRGPVIKKPTQNLFVTFVKL